MRQGGVPSAGLRSPRLAGVVAVSNLELEYTDFFRAEYGSVVRTLSLMLRDSARAEELAQDAFIQALQNWRRVGRYDEPRAWVRRVAIRLAMRAIRRDRLWLTIRERLIEPRTRDDHDLDVEGALRRLPANQRAVIVLRYYEDRTTEEIGSILGCSVSTVRVHLHRGRRRLATLLGEADSAA